MAVSSIVTLPAQPTVGASIWIPLGGDGVYAPIGYFDVLNQVVGDASGGNATLQINFDRRYTNLLSFVNVGVQADTAAGDFQIAMEEIDGAALGLAVNGTLPGVAETFVTVNSAYMWYPPPVFYPGAGQVRAVFPNVDATETYQATVQVFAYNRDVRSRMNMTWLHQIVPSTNAPVAS